MRWMFWASTALAAGVVLKGLSRNDGGKFVRTQRQQGCLMSYANLAGSDMQRPLDLVCCQGNQQYEAVCVAGSTRTTKLFTSKWAFVIPLAALAINAVCDWLVGGATAARRRARWNRFWLYAAVIAGRTLVLYLGLNHLQVVTQAEESRNCWYAHLRRSGRCSEHFDFADHVVLGLCQYFAIQVFELSCTIRENWGSSCASAGVASSVLQGHQPPSSLSSSSSSASSSSTSTPRPQASSSPFLCTLPSMAVCLAVAAAALVMVHDTAAFFHTRAETVVAVAISWFAVGLPLLGLMEDPIGGGGGGGEGAKSPGQEGRSTWGGAWARTNRSLNSYRSLFVASSYSSTPP